jgi:membrane-associated phospholipid phosphatase
VKTKNSQLFKTGLPLFVVCLVALVGFFLVTLFRANFHSVDVATNIWIPSLQSNSLTLFAQGVALIFDTTSLVIVSLVISGFLFLKNYKAHGLLLLGAMGGDALIVSILKTLEHVARPTNQIFFDTGFSYPSGHSAGCVVFGGLLAYFAWRHWQSRGSRLVIGAGLVTVIGVVGFDRVYLNVHWLSDVFGGWLFGAFWLSFAVLVFWQLQLSGRLGSKRFVSVANWVYLVAVVVSVLVVLFSMFGNFMHF